MFPGEQTKICSGHPAGNNRGNCYIGDGNTTSREPAVRGKETKGEICGRGAMKSSSGRSWGHVGPCFCPHEEFHSCEGTKKETVVDTSMRCPGAMSIQNRTNLKWFPCLALMKKSTIARRRGRGDPSRSCWRRKEQRVG